MVAKTLFIVFLLHVCGHIRYDEENNAVTERKDVQWNRKLISGLDFSEKNVMNRAYTNSSYSMKSNLEAVQ